MNVKKIILVNVIVSCLLIAGGLVIHHMCFSKKIAFVRLNDVYTKFELTKSYEQKAEKAASAKNNILDSLKLKIEILYRNLQAQKSEGKKIQREDVDYLNMLRQEYTGKKENFDKTNEAMLKSFDEQIWTQINNYMTSFGKEKKYDLVLGANGSGSIMYSDQAIDVTDEAVNYINLKHSGN